MSIGIAKRGWIVLAVSVKIETLWVAISLGCSRLWQTLLYPWNTLREHQKATPRQRQNRHTLRDRSSNPALPPKRKNRKLASEEERAIPLSRQGQKHRGSLRQPG